MANGAGGRSGSRRWTGRNHAPRVPPAAGRPASDCTTADTRPCLRRSAQCADPAPAQSAGSGQRSNHCRSSGGETESGRTDCEGQVARCRKLQGSGPRVSRACSLRSDDKARRRLGLDPPRLHRAILGPAAALARRPARAEHVGGLAVDAVRRVDPELVAHPLVDAGRADVRSRSRPPRASRPARRSGGTGSCRASRCPT